ncbi:MAG: hypothetical protein RBT30_00420 [Patescibacteria group bacterium]|jgi:hypothetical protein|nr:hypothetical protein [Patescibacteria group bacterium]
MLSNAEQLSELELAVLKTLIFFNLFSYPLTSYELWRYLDVAIDFVELKPVLLNLLSTGKIVEKQGFYFLPGQEKLLSIRQQRYHFANRKLKIAKRVTRLFRLLPSVKFVALSNLIGRHNLRDGSDIDLFIVTKKNRIWLTRLFCAGFMKILGQRPKPGNKKDKICLSFYVDENHLDLSSLTNGDRDYYFNFWLAGLHPLYDAGIYHHQLMQANAWLKKYLPNGDFLLNNQSYRESPRSWRAKVYSLSIIRRLVDLFEYWAEAWQLKIMPQALKEKINLDSRVIIRAGVLKLYLVDRRQEFSDRYTEQVNKYFNAS